MASKQFLVNIDLNGVAKVINSMSPTADTDLVTKAYVDNLINGMSWKSSVRVATTTNINLAVPGATLDGVSMVIGDRVGNMNQTAGAENGIYVYNGPATAMTRASDADTSSEVSGMAFRVTEGSNADTAWLVVTDTIVLDTTALTFIQIGSSAPAATESTAGISEIATQGETDTGTDDTRHITPLKLANWNKRMLAYGLVIGDGSATSYAVTHNFNNRDYQVVVYRNSGNYDEISTEIQHGLNSATIVFNSAPSSNAFKVHIQARAS